MRYCSEKRWTTVSIVGAVVVETDVAVVVVVQLTARQAVKYVRRIDSLQYLLSRVGLIKNNSDNGRVPIMVRASVGVKDGALYSRRRGTANGKIKDDGTRVK